ncbi:poly(3-hydroxybutyrate) depolymerase [Sphingomonas oleivorans]|uniref:Poly(3-hydroxybutyrate) depolymerase n=1 Tax=Sphingomonas oleivorans TaxID=1735121 RepID=A0A2T5FXP4_9SPHN|nr:polyhydroxyalkanoate depolymerase [Sphingomonas oleivorans]PTQ10895.1 poly(3-hydroxybutyrate) depolymerase [Sphingomonas oleivorans]
MLYDVYQGLEDVLAPFRAGAAGALEARDRFGGLAHWPLPKSMFALIEVGAGARLTHKRPAYGIESVTVGNAEVAVREEVVFSLPFGSLLHFAKDDVQTPQPKMLVAAPLSGHFATLLRSTIATLLHDHDVYVTDWANARDVPLSAGSFGFDDYVDYLIRFLVELGPGANLLAVCQPCVQALAATAVMAEDGHPAQPRTMTLMAGPVDVRINPSSVNALATAHDLDWFERNLITRVPWRYAGRGRRVYPGFLQLTAFMSMNMGRHAAQHRALYQFLADGDAEEATKIRDFYDEYFAVLDLTAEFYLETIDKVFQRAELARGELDFRGARVNPGKIRRTALLTVEGERDDICAVGQTAAAHDLCTGLRPHLKRHHLQAGVGHYGVFSGRKWETQVYPQIRNLVLAMS